MAVRNERILADLWSGVAGFVQCRTLEESVAIRVFYLISANQSALTTLSIDTLTTFPQGALDRNRSSLFGEHVSLCCEFFADFIKGEKKFKLRLNSVNPVRI